MSSDVSVAIAMVYWGKKYSLVKLCMPQLFVTVCTYVWLCMDGDRHVSWLHTESGMVTLKRVLHVLHCMHCSTCMRDYACNTCVHCYLN